VNVKIFIYKSYNELSACELGTLIDSLPEFRRQEVLAYKNAADQKARAVVYRLLRDELGYNPQFAYNEFGKPYIMRNDAPEGVWGDGENTTGGNSSSPPPVAFSFSHSKTIAAAALVYGTAELGLDVEDELSERRAAAAARIMTDAEKRTGEQAVKFWTLKESLLKCHGTGFSGGASANLDFSAWAESETFCAYGKYFFSRAYNGFYLALCAACPFSVTVLFTGLNI
jgi:phosphopantetheinyl transferase